MKKFSCLLVLLLCACAHQIPSPPPLDETAWWRGIDFMNDVWIPTYAAQNKLEFMNKTVQALPNGHKLLFARFEFNNAGNDIFSAAATIEFDCASQYRITSSEYYARRNFIGHILNLDNVAITDWSVAIPSSPFDTEQKYACQGIGPKSWQDGQSHIISDNTP